MTKLELDVRLKKTRDLSRPSVLSVPRNDLKVALACYRARKKAGVLTPEDMQVLLMAQDNQEELLVALVKEKSQDLVDVTIRDHAVQVLHKSHSTTRCMSCKKSPEVAYQWADGRGLAWFCKSCAAEWKREGAAQARSGGLPLDIVKEWQVPGGDVQKVLPHKFKKAIDANEVSVGLVDPRILMVEKALPKKDPSDQPVKKTKTDGKASKKQVGSGGKPRYTYPGEKGGDKKKKEGPPAKQRHEGGERVPEPESPNAQQPEEPEPLVVDPVRVPPDQTQQKIDPAHLANQLGVSVQFLTRYVERFKDLPGGREKFIQAMQHHLKGVANKHKLPGDYFGQLFDQLTNPQPDKPGSPGQKPAGPKAG